VRFGSSSPTQGSWLTFLILFLSFFFFLSNAQANGIPPTEPQNLINKATALQLYNRPAWQALLHAKHGKPNIFDSAFLLSEGTFSLKNELNETVNLLFSPTTKPNDYCRFPARYLWLTRKLHLPAKSLEHCEGLQEFRQRAPVEKVSVIYASENLVSPSSMMGHIFIKIGGQRQDEKTAEHSLSYFTNVQGFNLPKLMFDSLVSGKKGFFALNPFSELELNYLKNEQRNIWDYELSFGRQQLTLFQAHLWELKETELTYYFDRYNCATFTYYVLAVAHPTLLDEIPAIASPLDVVKSINNRQLVTQTSLTPSSKWQTRMLGSTLDDGFKSSLRSAINLKNMNELKKILTNAETNPEEKFLRKELAQSYAQFLFESDDLPESDYHDIMQIINLSQRESDRELSLDLSNYKSPLLTQADSQFYASIRSKDGTESLRIGYLPAATKIEDDHRQYFGEIDLRIFDLSLLASNHTSPHIEVDEFSLYSVSALLPRDPFTGGISGRFSIGAKPHYDKELDRYTAFDLNIGAGLSYQLSNDVLIYALAGGGQGYYGGRFYGYTDPEIGVVIEEIFDMKSHLSVQHIWNQDRSGSSYLKYGFDQSLFLNPTFGLIASYGRVENRDNHIDQFELTFKYYH
jgi:hypothetical protein